jgi:hypothetical protein
LFKIDISNQKIKQFNKGDNWMLDKIHLMISIFAAIVVTILSIIQRVEPLQTAKWMIIVIVVFYFAGLIIQRFLQRRVFFEDLTQDEDDFDVDDENILFVDNDDTQLTGNNNIQYADDNLYADSESIL